MIETTEDSGLSSTAFTKSILDKKGRTTLAEFSLEIDIENLKKLKNETQSLFSEELEKYVEAIMTPINTALIKIDDRGLLARKIHEFIGDTFVSDDDNHPLKEFLKNSYDQAVSNSKNKSQVTVSVQGDERELWISYEDNAGGFSNKFIEKAQKNAEAVLLDFEQNKDVSYENFSSQEDSKKSESLRKSDIESDKSSKSDMSGGQGWGLGLQYKSAKEKGGDLLIRNKIQEDGFLGGVITIRVPRVETAKQQAGRRRVIGGEGFSAAMQEPVSVSTRGAGLKINISGDSLAPLKISRSRDIFLPTPSHNPGTASTKVTSITTSTTSNIEEGVPQSPRLTSED